MLTAIKREHWLDGLKGMAIILVVLGHILDGATGQSLFIHDGWMEKLHAFIYIFHMPLFFLLSGAAFAMSFESKGRMNSGGYWTRCLNLLLIYVFWSAVMYCSKSLLSSEVSVVYKESLLYCLILAPVDPYWYLIVLLYYYIIFLTWRDGWKSNIWMKKIFTGCFIISGLAPLIQSGLPGRTIYFVYRILYHSVFFVSGILIVQYKTILKERLSERRWLLLPALLLSIAILYYDRLLIIPFVRECAAFGIVFSLLSLFWNHPVWEKWTMLNWLGRNSIYIYLTHNYITVLFRIVYKKSGITLPSGIYVGSCLITALFLCGCACVIAKKFWILNIFFQPVKTINRIYKRNKEE